MINDNIANCIAYFLHESQDFSFRQLPPGWPPIPLLARRLSRLKVVVSTFQSVCGALNASAASIQNMRVDHRRADISVGNARKRTKFQMFQWFQSFKPFSRELTDHSVLRRRFAKLACP
jgi:hypothetical protein